MNFRAETMPRRVGGRRGEHGSLGREPGWSRPRVQISVVVANIRTRPSKTEVEKGSVPTAVEHGSVGPKTRAKVFPKGAGSVMKVKAIESNRIKSPNKNKAAGLPSKGNRVNIPEPGLGEGPGVATLSAAMSAAPVASRAKPR